jgi:hypothetical protein
LFLRQRLKAGYARLFFEWTPLYQKPALPQNPLRPGLRPSDERHCLLDKRLKKRNERFGMPFFIRLEDLMNAKHAEHE